MGAWSWRSAAAVLGLASLLVALPALAQQEAWRAVNHRSAQLYRAGRYADSIAAAQQGLRLCDSAGRTEVFCRSIFWENMADDYVGLHQAHDAEVAFKNCLAIREAGLPAGHPLIGAALERLGIFYARQQRWHEAKPLLEQAAGVLRGAGDAAKPRLVNTLSWLISAAANSDDPAASVAAAREAAATADAIHSPLALSMHMLLADTLQKTGHDEEALGQAADTLKLAVQATAPVTLQLALVTTAVEAECDLGRWDAALSGLAPGQAILASGAPVTLGDRITFLLAAARARQGSGQLTEASSLLAQVRHSANQPGSGVGALIKANIAQQSGRLERALGHPGAARNDFKQAADQFATAFGPDDLSHAHALQSEAVAASDQGDAAAADALMDQELGVLHRIAASPAWLAPAERLASEMALHVGDAAKAERLIDEAGQTFARLTRPSAIERALYLAQLAEVEVARAGTTEARGHLRQAYALLQSAKNADPAGAENPMLTIASDAIDANDNDLAVRAADSAIALQGGRTDRWHRALALISQGFGRLGLGDTAGAASACGEAAKLVDVSASWFVWAQANRCLGLAEEELDEPKASARTLTAALAATPAGASGDGERMSLLTYLGATERDLGQYDDALARLDRVVGWAQAGGQNRLGTLFGGLVLRGSVLRRLGRYPQAEHDILASLEICTRLACGALERAEALNDLGLTRLDAGNAPAAEQPLRDALALRRKAGILRLVMETQSNIADLDLVLGRVPAAAKALAALDHQEEQAGLGDTWHHAVTLGREAAVARRTGDDVAAERLVRAAIAIDTGRLPPGHPMLANLSLDLAALLDARGADAEATALRRSAVQVIAKAYGADSAPTAEARLALLPELERRGDVAAITRILDQCQSATEAAYGTQSPKLIPCLTAAAKRDLQRLDLAAAGRDADRALAIVSAVFTSGNPALASPLLLRARVDIAAGHPSAALARCAAADAMLGPNATPVARISVDLIRESAQFALADLDGAEATVRSGLALLPAGTDPSVVNLRVALLSRLSALLIHAGKAQQAVAIWRDALAAGLPDWAVPGAQGALGNVLAATGHPEQAAPVFLARAAALARLHGETAWQTQDARDDAALALADAGRFDFANEQLRLAGAATDWESGVVHAATLASVAMREGKSAAALALLSRTASLLAARYGADSPARFGNLVLLARVDLSNGRDREAADLLHRAEAMATAHPYTANLSLAELRGEIALHAGKLTEAGTEFRRAAKLAAGPFGSARAEAASHVGLGRVYLKSERLQEARREFTTARTLMEASAGRKAPATGDVILLMAEVVQRQGDRERAEQLRRQAGAILGNTPAVGGSWL